MLPENYNFIAAGLIVPKLQQNDAVALNIYYFITGVWEYKTPPEYFIDTPYYYVPEVTITLTFDGEQVSSSFLPQDFDEELSPFRYTFIWIKVSQYVVREDSMFYLHNGIISDHPLYSITRLTPNSMMLHYLNDFTTDKHNIENYLFTRKTK